MILLTNSYYTLLYEVVKLVLTWMTDHPLFLLPFISQRSKYLCISSFLWLYTLLYTFPGPPGNLCMIERSACSWKWHWVRTCILEGDHKRRYLSCRHNYFHCYRTSRSSNKFDFSLMIACLVFCSLVKIIWWF